jgi:c-di-GMP-binding flagellar brake protein YcgR
MSLADIYSKAKIYHLTAEELDFILEYAKKLSIDPERVLVNKSLFNKLVETYKKESLKPNEKMIETIRQKLGFINPIEATFNSSKDFPAGINAKFYFDKYAFAPIKLEKNQPDYMLWQVISHRNMDKLIKGVEGTVIIDDRYGRSYKFPSKILDELKQNVTLVRTPHADKLELLQNRKYPRVAIDIPGYVQKLEGDKALYKALLCNISVGGLKIFIESDKTLFQRGEKLLVKFEIEGRKIETPVKVVYSGNMNYYGLMFEDLDFQSRRAIEKYISKNLEDLI